MTEVEEVADILRTLDADVFVNALLKSLADPSIQQFMKRLACQNEEEAKALYEDSFKALVRQKYSWKYQEFFEISRDNFILNWKNLLNISPQKLWLIRDFYSKAGEILSISDSEGLFLYSVNDFVVEKVQQMRAEGNLDDPTILKLCSILDAEDEYGQSCQVVEMIKKMLASETEVL
jgi:hypothetical protein